MCGVIWWNMEYSIKPIAYIHNDFNSKFGVPHQSGVLSEMLSTVVFEPEYRNESAFRGIRDFSHLWLIWQFSEAVREKWSPTVRPPRLGGNKRVGVFATRSPFRPNSLALTCVKLVEYRNDLKLGPTLIVAGADMMNNTPIFDVKPYLPLYDSIPDAVGGFTGNKEKAKIKVDFPNNLLEIIPDEKIESLLAVLRSDPRPSYHNESTRVYGMDFAGYNIKFIVDCSNTLKVIAVEKLNG